jgi:hypothetical protein
VLWAFDGRLLLVAILAVFLLATEAGFRRGRRYRQRSGESVKAHVGALQAGLLGLLALLLGFTFAMAVSRFDTRKSLVLAESNAIGTAYLRADILPAAQRLEFRRQFKPYVAARLGFFEAGIDERRLEAAHETATRICERLWSTAAAAAEQDPHAVSNGLLIQSLNDMFDFIERRRVALDDHVPETVIWLLIVVSASALGFIGYGNGLADERHFASTALFAATIALVLAIILDLDRPRRGMVRVSQVSMLRLQATLDADTRGLHAQTGGVTPASK